MSFSKSFKREIEVAFSKHAQPIWFRILKYILLGCLIYFLWGNEWIWLVFGIIFILSLSLHFWYRYKTKGWTKSYGAWDYKKNKSSLGK